jgi:hypothetical protein
MGLMTIFYCLKFEITATWRARSLRKKVTQIYLQALGSLSSPLTTHRATAEVFDPPPHGKDNRNSKEIYILFYLKYILQSVLHREHFTSPLQKLRPVSGEPNLRNVVCL